MQTHFTAPANLTFADWRELIGRVREQMDKGEAQPAWGRIQASGVLCPLLYMLMRATRRTETKPNSRMGERFAVRAMVRLHYLHLVFECDPAIQEPPVASLMVDSRLTP